jgi:hypothetical protein
MGRFNFTRQKFFKGPLSINAVFRSLDAKNGVSVSKIAKILRGSLFLFFFESNVRIVHNAFDNLEHFKAFIF